MCVLFYIIYILLILYFIDQLIWGQCTNITNSVKIPKELIRSSNLNGVTLFNDQKKTNTKQTNNGPQNFIFDLYLYDVDLRHIIFMHSNSYITKDLRSADPIEIEQAIVLSRGSVLATSTQYMYILKIHIGSRYIIFRNA